MKINFLLLLVIFLSCSNNNEHKNCNENSSVKPNSLEFSHSYSKIFKFEDYWNEFRIAIQTNDTTKIKKLVKIPLEILGREDQDPHLKIENNQVVKYLMLAVHNGGYYDVDKDTSISNEALLLSDLKYISEYNPMADIQWYNDFVFEKTSQGWKLTTLYMDTKKMKIK